MITNILILTNTKFVENRVYDEDIKEIACANDNSVTSQPVKSEQNDEQVINKLKNSIENIIDNLKAKYEVSPNVINSFDKYNLLNVLYNEKNLFNKRKLPYLIGSNNFLNDTFVGLKTDNDSPVLIMDNASDRFSNTQNDTFDEYTEENIVTQDSLSQDFQTDYQDNNVKTIENPIIVDDENDDDIFTSKISKPTENTSKSNYFEEIGVNSHDEKANSHSSLFKYLSDDDLFSDTVVKSKVAIKNDTLDNEKPEVVNKPKFNNQSAISLFSSDDDDEEIDIFSKKLTKQTSSTTHPEKLNSFLDSDDDDLFSNVMNNETAKANDPVVKEASKPPSHAKKNFDSNLLNVINELNSTLHKKEELASSTNKEIEHSEKEEFEAEKSESENQSLNDESLTSNNFNNILKHKAKLNSNRNRKLPTKYRSIQNQKVDEPSSEQESNSKSEKTIDTQTSEESVDKIKSKVITKTSSFFSSSDDSDSDLFNFQVKTSNKESTKMSDSSGLSFNNNTKTQPSFFDSSDDNDDDIFNTSYGKQKNKDVVSHHSSEPKKPNQTFIFSDSDDDDFLSNEPKLENNSANKSVPKKSNTNLVKKSIFDDDSDDGKYSIKLLKL